MGAALRRLAVNHHWGNIRQPPKTPDSALRSLDKMLIYLM